MVLMDGTWSETFDAETLAAIRNTLEVVRKYRGCVSINFHPESFTTVPATWEYFKRIVEMCKELGADLSMKGPRLIV
jgi:histidinol phosphatase-like PHP family hydrolase